MRKHFFAYSSKGHKKHPSNQHLFLLKLMFILLFISSIFLSFIQAKLDNDTIEMSNFLQNEDIKNTWPRSMLEHCRSPRIPLPKEGFECFIRQFGYENVRIEVLNKKPPILRIPQFLLDKSLSAIAHRFRTSSEVESQGVEGYAYSAGHRGRQTDGLWLLHHEKVIRPLFERIQRMLALNPAFAEDFLVLKYDPFGHYAPHFDHLQPMPPNYDEGWFAYFGNRLATALLLVETAKKGGFTVFPKLGLTINPERGDLLLWFNADSNDQREEEALHAACPILEAQKIAVSLWIRGNFQDGLKCTLDNPSYEPVELIRKHFNLPNRMKMERPKIPNWVFNY